MSARQLGRINRLEELVEGMADKIEESRRIIEELQGKLESLSTKRKPGRPPKASYQNDAKPIPPDVPF